MDQDTKKSINVLQRALQLMECLSESSGGKRILQLAEDAGLPPSTTHRILQTLAAMGYVRQDSINGVYRLTGKLLDIGGRAVVGRSLREEALPHLRRLRELTGESSHLVVLDRKVALTVESVLSEERNLIDSRVGERAPVHCTAVGKCLIAYLPELEDFLSRLELKRFTDNTVCTVSGLLEELTRVREQGYALDWEENEVGIRCIAAPVMGASCEVVASLGISGPAVRVTEETLEKLISQVKGVACDISQAIGWNGPKGSVEECLINQK